MNLTKLIEETGRRVRLGKPSAAKLTNTEVKEVLETAVEILKEALIKEGRVEIQHFAVIEAKRMRVKSFSVNGQPENKRIRWTFRPSTGFRKCVKPS